jgi:hypothetical protein
LKSASGSADKSAKRNAATKKIHPAACRVRQFNYQRTMTAIAEWWGGLPLEEWRPPVLSAETKVYLVLCQWAYILAEIVVLMIRCLVYQKCDWNFFL